MRVAVAQCALYSKPGARKQLRRSAAARELEASRAKIRREIGARVEMLMTKDKGTREIGISVEIARDRGDRARDQMLTKMRVSESGMMIQPRATRQIASDRLHLREICE